MLWAFLAKFLIRQPPLVQALIVGLCVGLFVTTGAHANDRDPVIGTVALQVTVVGAIAGTLFFVGLVSQRGRAGKTGPLWPYVCFALVWLGALSAGLLALFGAGGFKVAALSIVPLVLLAPLAFEGFRLIGHREHSGA